MNVKCTVTIETAGKYKVDVGVRLHGSFEFDASRYTVVFRIDGLDRSTNEYGWDESKLLEYEFSEDFTAGEHELSFELTPVPMEVSDEPNSSGESTYARFEVDSVRIESPEGTTKLVHPPNYSRFFPRDEPPVDAIERRVYAEEILNTFRSLRGQGFRRELTPEEQKTRDRFRELRGIADRFDDDLKGSMRRETELCVEHIARENLSLLDLLDCNYTFVNETLANHYGIPDVKGGDMRRVDLPADSVRGGVLSHASMLLLTSNPTRTSPVKRGLFILDNIPGTPSPPAPPNVPELEAAVGKFGDREPTLRELLAAHRESALCASCHTRMDPLGLALENFNALGIWRTEEKGSPIDASGTLITGESFKDVRELKHILREHHTEDFYRCVTQKMLTFAIGRGMEYSDEQTVDIIVARLQSTDGKFSELIDGVINSAPFQKIRNPERDGASHR